MEKLLLPPNETQSKMIKEQINEIDDEKLEHNLKLFQKWIECQPHLPKNYEKNMLNIYLRGTKHNLEKAKKKMEFYFFCKTAIPSLWQFKPFTAEELKIVNNLRLAPMPHLTDNGCRFIVFNVRDSNIDLFDTNLIIKNVWRFSHLRACKEHLIAGDIYLFDAALLTPAHVAKMMTPDFKKSIRLAQDGFASRIKQIYVVNAPIYVEKFMSVVKMMSKEKFRERFHVDQGTSHLKSCVDEKTLPIDYGGTAESVDAVFSNWMQYFDDNHTWLEDQKQITLVGEIPKKTEYITEIDFGAEGSFRQLSID